MLRLGLVIEKGEETVLLDCETGEIYAKGRDDINTVLAYYDAEQYTLELC